jgi:hypothetical protein
MGNYYNKPDFCLTVMTIAAIARSQPTILEIEDQKMSSTSDDHPQEPRSKLCTTPPGVQMEPL